MHAFSISKLKTLPFGKNMYIKLVYVIFLLVSQMVKFNNAKLRHMNKAIWSVNETVTGMCVYILRNTSCLPWRRSMHALPVKLQILSKVGTLPNLMTPFSSK